MCKPVNELLDARKSRREVIDPISEGRVPTFYCYKGHCN